jgi:hypothetical protein
MRVEGGQTALLDALYLAGDYLTKNALPDGTARDAARSCSSRTAKRDELLQTEEV